MTELVEGNPTKDLVIGTFNVENIKTNKVYVCDLLQKCQLLFLQEHWLFAFEKDYLNKEFPDFNNCAKSCDEYDQIPRSYRTRGHAGVAVMWHKCIDKYIEILDCQSERILPIRLNLGDLKVVIISSYMPAGNARGDIAMYQETLDIVYDLICRNSKDALIIWLGDLNGSLTRLVPYKRDTLLREFCVEQKLTVEGDITTHTFHGHSGSSSRIDHILMKENQHILHNQRVLPREATNSSTHDPILANLSHSVNFTTKQCSMQPAYQQATRKVVWNDVNIQSYYGLSGDYIKSIKDPHTMSTDELLSIINNSLYKASTDALTRTRSAGKKQRHRQWNPVLKPFVTLAKKAFKNWKMEGRPQDHPAHQEMKLAKRQLRSAQRQLEASARHSKIDNILDAANSDQRRFHKLISMECSTRSAMPAEMEFNGQTISNDKLIKSWADYFQGLATPKNKAHYIEDHSEYINLKYESIVEENARSSQKHLSYITDHNVLDIISELKNNKAADINGITAEHLKHAHPNVVRTISILLNRIVSEGTLPAQMRHGLITPVFKQKKSPRLPDNYRRITVIPMVGKLMEKILVKPTKVILAERLSNLQRGFCDHSSSINTALLLSEAASEAKDLKLPLFVAYLDASKAFDVVWHRSMLCKIHDLGITGDLWTIYNDMYKQMTSQVKCDGLLSQVIQESQGVRQGGIPSTELFKARGDALLQTISKSRLGFQIGTIDISAPTCADDIALVARNPVSLQALINIAVHDAHKERYDFSETKTKVMVMNNKTMAHAWGQMQLWQIDGRKLEVTSEETHLGIQRMDNCKASKSVGSNIQKARRSAYAMMGAGMHGINGLHIKVNLQLGTGLYYLN